MTKLERILKLQNELEDLREDLANNESYQEELRSIARGFKEEIKKIEGQLEELGAEDMDSL